MEQPWRCSARDLSQGWPTSCVRRNTAARGAAAGLLHRQRLSLLRRRAGPFERRIGQRAWPPFCVSRSRCRRLRKRGGGHRRLCPGPARWWVGGMPPITNAPRTTAAKRGLAWLTRPFRDRCHTLSCGWKQQARQNRLSRPNPQFAPSPTDLAVRAARGPAAALMPPLLLDLCSQSRRSVQGGYWPKQTTNERYLQWRPT